MQDIVVTNLSKHYGTKQVLDGFSAVFAAGRVSCVMGRSGCGKTTLLNILMGLCRPDGGSVQGVPKKLAAVFQEDRLCESFSAGANAALAAPHTDAAALERHFAAVGLAGSLHTRTSQLSGGMKRRVAIVRAVLAQSDALFLDEPFKGLDEDTRALTVRYLTEHTAGKTVIMVTHSALEVSLMGGSLITLPEKGADNDSADKS